MENIYEAFLRICNVRIFCFGINAVDSMVGSFRESVTLIEVRQALIAVDPAITEEICREYLQRGFGISLETWQENVQIAKSKLLANLRGGSIRRVNDRIL